MLIIIFEINNVMEGWFVNWIYCYKFNDVCIFVVIFKEY